MDYFVAAILGTCKDNNMGRNLSNLSEQHEDFLF